MELKDLATYVQEQPGVGAAVAAAHFGVSTRTLRGYVSKFNEAFEGSVRIGYSRSQGYRLEVLDAGDLEASLARLDTLNESGLPSTPEQRVAYLIDDLLSRNGWVKLDELARALFVSPRTVSNDLVQVEKRLSGFGLALEKRPRYGIRVSGSEKSKRSCWTSVAASMIAEPVAGAGQAGRLEDLDGLIDPITQIVEDVLQGSDRMVSSVSLQNLILHIAIAVIRIRSGAYVPMDAQSLGQVQGEDVYALAEAIAARVEKGFDLELPAAEVGYIAIHLSGRFLSSVVEGPRADDGTGVVMDSDVWQVVSSMIETVDRVFGFDFSGDLELRMNLCRHVAPLGVRLSNNMALQNPLLDDIKRRYPLAYAMAADSSAILALRYGAEPSDDEVGYIALSYALALERLREGAPKKRVLLACASGAGTSNLLAFRFKQEFAPFIDTLETCDVMSLRSRDFTGIDYVFATVPVPFNIPVPVQLVSPFLDEKDLSGVHHVLERHAHKREAIEYFDEGLFFPHLRFDAKEDALGFLAEAMSGRYGAALGSGFKESVLEREESFSTAFGNFVAVPHPAVAVSRITAACVGVLDEPLRWDSRGNEVRLVVLMAFSRKDTDEIKDLMSLLADLLTDEDLVGDLLRDQTWERFQRMLESSSDAPEG